MEGKVYNSVAEMFAADEKPTQFVGADDLEIIRLWDGKVFRLGEWRRNPDMCRSEFSDKQDKFFLVS